MKLANKCSVNTSTLNLWIKSSKNFAKNTSNHLKQNFREKIKIGLYSWILREKCRNNKKHTINKKSRIKRTYFFSFSPRKWP